MVLTGLEPVVSLCSVSFAMVVSLRCRLRYFLAQPASASLHPPQAALGFGAPSIDGATAMEQNKDTKKPFTRNGFWWSQQDSNL